MSAPRWPRLTVVGPGLIGGSIGLALRERELADEVIGVGRRMASLEKAQQRGAIDRATTNLVEGVAGADWVIIATPVDSIVDTVSKRAVLLGDLGMSDLTIHVYRDALSLTEALPTRSVQTTLFARNGHGGLQGTGAAVEAERRRSS